MELTPEQINEVCRFQQSLSREDEWLFFNMAAVRAIEEGTAVTYEDKWDVMQKWDSIMENDND